MKKNIIKICMGSSCFSRGNRENIEIIKMFLKKNDLDTDILLIGNLCEAECKTGPNIFLNETLYKNVSNNKIDEILSDLKKEL
ncbi:MAG: (2Fe-2S) ferredoxin domain-containing protein [Spirochaetaceae bacterium]